MTAYLEILPRKLLVGTEEMTESFGQGDWCLVCISNRVPREYLYKHYRVCQHVLYMIYFII
jgi:hypothetical protein